MTEAFKTDEDSTVVKSSDPSAKCNAVGDVAVAGAAVYPGVLMATAASLVGAACTNLHRNDESVMSRTVAR